MGKHLRYVILAFSVVLAIFLFALIWQVRPLDDGTGLSDAENRQNQGMSAVFRPEGLSDEEKAEVGAYLLSDEDFISSLSQAIAGKLPASSGDDVDVDALVSGVIDSVKDDPAALYALIEESVESDIDEKISAKEDEIAALVPVVENNVAEKLSAYVDSQTPSFVDQVAAKVLEREDAFVSSVTERVIQSIDLSTNVSDESVSAIEKSVTENVIKYALSEWPYIRSEIEKAVKAEAEGLEASVTRDILSRDDAFVDPSRPDKTRRPPHDTLAEIGEPAAAVGAEHHVCLLARKFLF